MGKTAILVYLVVPAALSVALFWSDAVAAHLPNDSRVLFLEFCVTHGLLAGLAYLTRAVYVFIYSPLVIYGDEGRDSYFIEKGQAGINREDAIAAMKRSRKIEDMPPVYPNGWFIACTSASLKKMETKYVHMLGLNLAVFRGESGRAYIIDAYCPHLGANLAVGGKVTGECIECPFHGWTYQGEDGKCVKIAYADKVPDFVKVPTYRSMEINNMILLWYHAEGEEPSWYPPELEKIKSGEMTLDGTFEFYVDCHIQDVAENSADEAHLQYLHGP
ncbi:cholesterol 7-desaturase-like [Acanthaster planci]|uniref:cholesterol 7-desaturase n=1 Tax=Acanthaster planci TaxID=133434 RepID=A0A8B7Y4S1_ACAPL|nr:cholesterol 7-desaturase-like [Acanthaster planci]